MRRQSARTVAAATLVVFAVTSVASAWYPYSEKYTKWQKDRPFMMAGLHNSAPKDNIPERVARFKAGGMNTFLWMKTGKALPFFEEASSQGLAWAGGWRAKRPVISKAIADIPGCAFFMTGDEPNNDPKQFAVIAEFTEWFTANHPDIPQFANLSIAKAEHDVVIETTKPDIFSFDHYPLLRNGELADDYMFTLMWGRRTAQKHKLPYWIFLQSYGREAEKASYAYRDPDEADIRFQIFTFLAHGGTGVMWFLYYGMDESSVRDMVIGDDMPRKDGRYEDTKELRSWWAIRDAAAETHNLARALLNLRSKDPVAYIGNPKLWDYKAPGYPIKPADPFRLQAFEGHSSLKTAEVTDGDDPGLLVGFFDDKVGEEYFMVVNLTHGANMSKTDGMRTVRLTFDKSIETIERLNRLTGRVETLRTTPAEGGLTSTLDVFLPGGTGDLFKWANGNPWDMREE